MLRWACFLLVALLGLGLRLYQLDARPMHTDEAVNAYLVGRCLAGQPFHYDATDRHGPALVALALPLVRAAGAHSFAELTEREVRLVPVLVGFLTLLLFGTAVPMFGFGPCLWAAVLTVFAPLPLYYDRYFIHEPLLVAATLLLMSAAFALWRRPSIARAALVGACVAWMLSTKETAVVNLAALVLAACCSRPWQSRRPSVGAARLVQLVVVAVAVCLLVGLAFYTWMGQDWGGLTEPLHAVPRVFTRAAGEGHQKPFWYFASLLASGRSGLALLCLTAAGAVLGLRGASSRSWRTLASYGAIVAAFYSLIPYKTPWLALNVWLPFVLLAGLALDAAIHGVWAMSQRRLVMPLLGIGMLLLAVAVGNDTFKRVYLHPADEDNPYAYAHTSEDLLGLPAAIDRLALERGIVSPRLAVIAADPWPLPWYLRRYRQTGFWQPGQDPGTADFYLTSTDLSEQNEARLRGLRPEFFGIRPGVLILVWSRDLEQAR